MLAWLNSDVDQHLLHDQDEDVAPAVHEHRAASPSPWARSSWRRQRRPAAQGRGTIPLGRILDIRVTKPLIGRLLNYGHFVFESAAQVHGISEIPFVADIHVRDVVLQQTVERAGLRAAAPAQDDGT